MDLFIAIALLCQVSSGSELRDTIAKKELECQQSYVHCINIMVASDVSEKQALNKCILERKL